MSRALAQTVSQRSIVAAVFFVVTTSPLVAWPDPPPLDLSIARGWHDNRAEVAGYRVRSTKYGVERHGDEFLITVLEEQDRTSLVKALPGAPASQRRDVIKLNRELTVPTGIYTYRQFVSAFLTLDALELTKIVTSSQEWCGTTFAEAVVRDGKLLVTSFSYLEGEGDKRSELPWPRHAWAADALPVLARALPSDEAGSRSGLTFLPSLLGNRIPEPRTVSATVEWSGPENDASGRRVQRVVVSPEGSLPHVLVLEAGPPRRVLEWSRGDGSVATMVAAERLAYWRMTSPGQERDRAALLVSATAARDGAR